MNDAVITAEDRDMMGGSSRARLVAEMRPILNPSSVAVVGASNSPTKFGRFFFQSFLDMGLPRLYAVNPRETEVLACKAYPKVSDIPDEVDLAFIVTPLDTVLPVVADCGAKGVKGVVVYSSGFAEKGAEGISLEREIVRVARQHGTRIIGPNCMGLYSPKAKLSFYPGLPTESGPIAMISQSGSLSVFVILMADSKRLRFNTVVSCGNESDLNSADFLEYFGSDPEVQVITAYLEGVKDGRRFVRLAREISHHKPIIAVKAGMTERGGRAAGSHTGTLAGSGRVWQAVFEQTGIIGVSSIEEMVDTMVAFSRLPRLRGPRVAIVTGPGGPGVLAADACVMEGLEVADLSTETRARLSKLMPKVGTSPDNPVDLGMGTAMDPSGYGAAIEALALDGNVDAILAIGSDDSTFCQIMVDMSRAISQPLVVANLMPPERFPEGYLFLAENGVAVYPDPRRAIGALAKLYRYQQWVS